MFLKHANEERQHARGLIEYLSMRGEEIGANEIPTLVRYSFKMLNLH